MFKDVGSFAARIILGYIFFMHGWQKLVTNGMVTTTEMFTKMGVPAPSFSAHFAAYVELVGGVLLIVGVLVPVVSLLLVIDMFGAIIYVHADHGLWSSAGGYEFPLALIAGLLAVGFIGSGRAGVDHHLYSRLRHA